MPAVLFRVHAPAVRCCCGYADPFDQGLCAHGCEEHRAPALHVSRLAHARRPRGLPGAARARPMRAMDSMGAGSALSRTRWRSGGEDISLKSISEDTSPVVRWCQLHAVRRAQDRCQRHPPRDPSTGWPHRQVPHRRRAGERGQACSREARHAEQVISRVKVMAELDIAERRVPQDGRFKVDDRRPRHRLSACVDHAQHPRRGRGAARYSTNRAWPTR